MDTIIYRTIQDRGCFRKRTNSIVGRGKNNLASNDVEYIDLPIVFGFYTSEDSEVLSTLAHQRDQSIMEELILYGRVQRFTIELSAHSPLLL